MFNYAIGWDNKEHNIDQKENIELKELRYFLDGKVYVQRFSCFTPADSIDTVKVSLLTEDNFIQIDFMYKNKPVRVFFHAGSLM